MKHFCLIAFTLILFSCNKKKDKSYTCSCDIHGNPYTNVTKTITAKSQSEATTQCNDYGKSEANGFHYECTVQ
jgi:hypothetical protein